MSRHLAIYYILQLTTSSGKTGQRARFNGEKRWRNNSLHGTAENNDITEFDETSVLDLMVI